MRQRQMLHLDQGLNRPQCERSDRHSLELQYRLTRLLPKVPADRQVKMRAVF